MTGFPREQIPLTPALSQRERENTAAHWGFLIFEFGFWIERNGLTAEDAEDAENGMGGVMRDA